MIKLIIFLFCIIISTPVFASSSQYVTTLNESLKEDSNAVYCPISNFIWDVLNKKIVNKDKIFPEQYFWADVILGYEGIDINNYIKEKNKEKFQDGVKELDQKFKEYDAVGYAAFFKQLIFYFKFYELDKGVDFFSENAQVHNVSAFGLLNYNLDSDWDIANQINVLDFIDGDDFIIKIGFPDRDVDLILAKISKQDSFDLMWKDCFSRINNNKIDSFHKGDSIIIPKLEFYRDDNFPGIVGKSVPNKDKEGWFFSAFVTQIGFNMNNFGTKDVVGKDEFVLTRNIYLKEKEVNESKKFIFDKPFLIALRKKGQDEPFFLLWVNEI